MDPKTGFRVPTAQPRSGDVAEAFEKLGRLPTMDEQERAEWPEGTRWQEW